MAALRSRGETRRRVKLYTLNDELQWEDKGTGHVTIASGGGMADWVWPVLCVRSEEDGSFLLQTKVKYENTYQIQEDTLIVWAEPDGSNLALSFQEKLGCDEVWETLTDAQNGTSGMDFSCQVNDDSEADQSKFEDIIELPPCEIGKLSAIADAVTHSLQTVRQRQNMALAIEQEGYIPKLLELFHMCEDVENVEGLHQLYDTFKALFLVNEPALLSIMLQEDTIMDVIGCLEWDPAKPEPVKHREYVQSKVTFHEVIPIQNPELVAKIHLLYKVLYVQEVILPTPSVFEENVMAALKSFVQFAKTDIVSGLQKNTEFMTQLFARLTDENTSETEMARLSMLLKEINNFSQALQPYLRSHFYQSLSKYGFLNVIEVMLSSELPLVVSAAVDIVTVVVEFCSPIVREFFLQQAEVVDEENQFLNIIIGLLVDGQNTDIDIQLVGLIRMLIDPDLHLRPDLGGDMAHVAPAAEKTILLTYFYKHCMHRLTAPLMANTTEDRISKDTPHNAILLGHILELLSFCVERHMYHIRHYIINRNLLGRVLVLMTSTQSHLALSALRFCRKIVGLKDEFYNRYIIRQDLFRPVVKAFLANGSRYNLLNSAIIELFEYTKTEDIKSLITYISEKLLIDLESVQYVDTFQVLKMKHLEDLDQRNASGGASSNAVALSSVLDGTSEEGDRFRRDPRAQDEDEELWFEDEQELEQETSTQAATPPRAPTPPLPLLPSTHTPQTPPINIGEARTPVEVSTEEAAPTYVGTPRPNPLPRPLTPLVDNLQQKPFKGLVDYEDEDDSDGEDDHTPPNGTDTAAKRPRLEDDCVPSQELQMNHPTSAT